MTDSTVKSGGNEGQPTHGSAERLVYVMPERMLFGSPDDEISARQLWQIIWRGKWVILALTVSFAFVSVVYALVQPEWYRAEVLLAPADERVVPPLAGQLGGLAALAGVSVGGDGSAEAVAVVRTRDFARAFIEEFELLPVFFADDWDAEADRWKGEDVDRWPDERDAIRYFHEKVLKVSEDRQSGFVTLAVEWTDPNVAAEWADALARRLNAGLRERALREAGANVAYLQDELAKTSVITLQHTIGRLLESELQKLMLARGNEEFAFRIIDSAEVPRYRVRPNRTLIAMSGTILGGMLGVMMVLFAQLTSLRFKVAI